MENNYKLHFIFFLFCLFAAVSCDSQKQPFTSPPGYDLNNPKRFRMPDLLREISGIAFNNGISDTLYAEEDENGRIYHFKLGDKQIRYTRFGKKGDFEDIAICNNYIIMLRSDGLLFTIPLPEANLPEALHVKEFPDLLPQGEYEGLACDNSSGKIIVLCKHCSFDKTRKLGGGSILQMDASGNLSASGEFEIKIKEIDAMADTRKINFHPSALAQNQPTKDWYILSATNKLLVITDQNWKVKSVYHLDPAIFIQPEGISFDRDQTLYISNERGLSPSATVFVFPFHNK